MNPCEWMWTADIADMKVMATYSEFTQFIPTSQTLLLDIILDPALSNILLEIS